MHAHSSSHAYAKNLCTINVRIDCLVLYKYGIQSHTLVPAWHACKGAACRVGGYFRHPFFEMQPLERKNKKRLASPNFVFGFLLWFIGFPNQNSKAPLSFWKKGLQGVLWSGHLSFPNESGTLEFWFGNPMNHNEKTKNKIWTRWSFLFFHFSGCISKKEWQKYPRTQSGLESRLTLIRIPPEVGLLYI